MNRSLIIYIAAALALLTAVIHLIGIFIPVPPELTEVIIAVGIMEGTMVPMPVGAARSYMQILNGNNFGTTLLLLVCALQLAAVARLPNGQATNRTLAVAGLGLAGFAIVSALFFFPVPAVLTALAAVLCFVARPRLSIDS